MAETTVVAAREAERYYTYSNLFYVNRHSFWDVGQDSWTLPPAQNQDMFAVLTNVEPVLQGILQRRRGYSTLPGNFFYPLADLFQHSYSYRNESQSLRRLVWSSLAQVVITDENGFNILPNAFLFAPSAGAFTPRMVLSRDYGYFADGVAADYKKWDGNSGGALTNWGIAVGTTPAGVFGPNGAGTVVDTPFNPAVGLPGGAWSNVTLAQGPPDGNVASITLSGNHNSDYIDATNYGFAVPAGLPIQGITVTLTVDETISTGIGSIWTVQLIKGGVPTGSTQTFVATSSSLQAYVLGSNTSGWGASLTSADVNASTFGVRVYVTKGGATGFGFSGLNVDSIQVQVSSNGQALAFTATGGGNISLLSGRTYFYAYQNSKALTVSDLSPPSLSTGPLSGSQVNITGIPPSSDPQVDTILLLATADGNDQTTLFLLATIPNGQTTYTDNTPDALTAALTTGPALLTNAVYQQTDAFGVLHGIANNKRPPAANFPVKHKGRIYMSLGSTLYFSKNLDEVTTSTGTITCKWEEAWPATNQIDISEQSETIQALMSDGETLWIATERGIRRLIGDSPSNFQKPEIEFNETGVLNQDCWKVTFYEGQPVGTMWITPDLRVMASDFNTYADVGGPIQDVLNSINVSAAQAMHASFVSKGPADYYMLYIPTGFNTLPDTVCVFNLRSKKWFIWKPTDVITTSLFVIDATGNPRWYFATNGGQGSASGLYEWLAGLFLDRVGNVPVSYPVTMQTSWLDFGDYNLRKFVNQIIPTTADNLAMTIQVDAASNEQDFNNPLSVVPATVVIPAAIPDDVFVPLASGPSHSRAFRFTFISPPSTIQNVLTGFAIESGVFHRY